MQINLFAEESQLQRLAEQRFIGLSLGGRVPDAKTIWLFKDTITQKNN